MQRRGSAFVRAFVGAVTHPDVSLLVGAVFAGLATLVVIRGCAR